MLTKAKCFIVDIQMSNDAFSEDRGAELARILERLAWRVRNGQDLTKGSGGYLNDVNGNICGSFKIIERRER